MSFSLKLKKEEVQIEDLDGIEQTYTINELPGKQRDEFLNGIGNRMKFNSAGKTAGLKNYDGLQSGLLALCLKDKNNESVPVKDLQDWPSSVLSGLFEIASKLSGLDKGADEEPKNE